MKAKRLLLCAVFLLAIALAPFLMRRQSASLGLRAENPEPSNQATNANTQASHETGAADADAKAEAEAQPELLRWRFGTRFGKETRPELSAFSAWANRYAAASEAGRAAMEEEGLTLARERRASVAKLIQTKPKLALAQTVPAVLREHLPPSIRAELEDRVSGKGDLNVFGTSPKDGGRGAPSFFRNAVIEGKTYRAHVFGSRLSQQTTSGISLHGIALDGHMAVSESPLRLLEEGEPLPDKPVASNSCAVSGLEAAPSGGIMKPGAVAAESGGTIHWLCRAGHIESLEEQVRNDERPAASAYRTTGPRSLLVMMIDFDDFPGGAIRLEDATPRMNQVANWLQTNSYNKINFTTRTLTPVLRMPRTGVYYASTFNGEFEMYEHARAAARAAGFNSDNFDFDMAVFTDIGFLWGGLGWVGAKGSWIQGDFHGGVSVHELGHNLGLWHANSWVSPTIIDPSGFHVEYGNTFAVMGRAGNYPQAHYTSNGKFQLGWLNATNIYTSTNVGASTYRIYAHDMTLSLNAARKYALRVPAGLSINGNTEDYWIDFRQLFASLYPRTASGAIVQWGNDIGDDGADRLLDMTPGTLTMDDSPLAVGQNFVDAASGLSISTLAKNGAGADAYIDVQVTRTNLPPLTLAQALDTTGTSWVTAAPEWVGQRQMNHDGSDAAGSGQTPDQGSSYMSATLAGPGTASFWWKVSSEEDFDYLRLFVDGNEIAKISGDVDWELRTINIGPGTHTITWRYTKDEFVSDLGDRGWVDQFSYESGNRPPTITFQPLSVTVNPGQPAEFRVEATGSDPLNYQWRKGPINLPGKNNRTLLIPSAQVSDAGTYSIRITNSFGAALSSNATLTVVQPVPLAEALDLPNMTWSTTGDMPWLGQNAVTFDGVDAAQSGSIGNNQVSTLQGTIIGPATLAFHWKVSSEPGFDFLDFYLDGTLKDSISGEWAWQEKTYQIGAGQHVIRWVYSKDISFSEGSDRGWVDNVRVQGDPNQPPRIAIQPQPASALQGGVASFSVAAGGTSPLFYYWYRGASLVSGPQFTGANSPLLTISPVDLVDGGNYTVVVSNRFGIDTSLPARLTVTSAGALANALDFIGQQWVSGGAAVWDAQTNITHDLVDAARSGSIDHSGESWFESQFVGPGTISFWCKVSSEAGFDFLDVSLDGRKITSLSGEVAWTNVVMNISSGSHRIRWTYAKDTAGSTGDDAAWVDQVAFTAGSNIGDAVDMPDALWQTGGAAGFVTVTDLTADGVDAARAGRISNNQESWFQTTFTGPGVVFYKWRTSSEEGYDTLSISVDGAQKGTISGEPGWREAETQIPAGQHIVRWTYRKDASDSFGLDTAWVDQISFVQRMELSVALDFTDFAFSNGGATNWIGVASPAHDGADSAQSGRISHNQESLFQATFAGPGTLSYWWRCDSEPNRDFLELRVDGAVAASVSGNQDWTRRTVSIPTGNHVVAWAYKKDENYGAGADAGWVDEISYVRFVDLQTALDTTDIIWTSGGTAPWLGQTGVKHDGVDSAHSGTITHRQQSWVEATITGPAQVSFWWKVSSEQGNDWLSLRMDDNTNAITRISGEVNWRRETVPVPAGPHRLRWQYAKDASASSGDDRGWLDQVTVGSPSETMFGVARIDADHLSVSLQQLTIGSSVILDSSTDLQTWVPVSTNVVATPTMNILRRLNTSNEFLRARSTTGAPAKTAR